MSRSREVIVVDPMVAGWEAIAERAGGALRVLVLDAAQDGLAQIAAALAGERGLAAIHLVSHGGAGQLVLGNARIDGAGLAQHAAALAQIGASLAEGGDILLYGCDIGKGAAGGFLVQELARATGADVAASNDLTGAASRGGDWELEVRVGAVDAAVLEAKQYAGTLAIVAGTADGEWLEGTAEADTLYGDGGDDILAGGAGDDTLDGGADGSMGDTVSYEDDPAGVMVNLQAGTATDGWGNTDTLAGIEHVNGSRHDDILIGSAGANWFRPGQGNDTVYGNGGDDVVMYEGGSAAIDADLQAGTVSGADIGSDTLYGIRNLHTGMGDDIIRLSDAGGYVFARGGDDTITGGAGTDTFYGGSGNDTINGGAGYDSVNYFDEYNGGAGPEATGLGVTVDLGTGVAIDNWGHTDTLGGIENIGGSRHGDRITGDAGDNGLSGEEGDDVLSAGDGRDWLNGGAGNDQLQAGLGDDTLSGGAGKDVLAGGEGSDRADYRYEHAGASPTRLGVTVNLATGIATDNWGDTDTLSGIEHVSGSRDGDSITGSAGDNSLQGQEGDDTIMAGDGRDWVDGGAGDDNLQGGLGDDSFAGGSGADTIDGGAGSDYAQYGSDYDPTAVLSGRGVTVNLVTGTAVDNWGDTDKLVGIENVSGSRLADSLSGNSGANNLYGAAGDDTLLGAGGDDYLQGGEGADKLDGGADRDTLTGGAGSDTLIGGDGIDRADYQNDYGTPAPSGLGVRVDLATGTATDNWGDADTLSGIEDVTGSRYADVITGNAGDNNLFGHEGNDTIGGGDGRDNLNGGAGNDWLQGSLGDDFLTGGAGTDIIDGGAGRDAVDYQSDYELTATATGLGVQVNLASGTAVDNWGHADTLAGIEDATGSRYADTLTGSAADNNLWGQAGNDTIAAGDGGDWVDGGDGADKLDGGLGDDRLAGGAGADTINGGEGRDSVFYSYTSGTAPTSGVGATVNLATGSAIDSWGNADKLLGIEDVNGSDFNDSITGSTGDNNLFGGAGNDTVRGGAGNDWLDGGAGTDTLLGEAGNDRLFGGAGNDKLDGGDGVDEVTYWSGLPGGTLGVTVNLATGTARDNWGNSDTLAGIENVSGSTLNDSITGNALDNSLRGDAGDDTLLGGDGRDVLGGGVGNDKLQGDVGDDRLNGEDGNDTLAGGDGNDFLDGGAGADTIDGGAGIDSVNYFGNGMIGSAGVTVNLTAGTATDNWGHADKLAGIENVTGSRLADTITGSAGDNSLSGGDGDDTLVGGAGNDFLNGGNGNDKLYGGAGRERFWGDAGNDTIDGGAITDLVGNTDGNTMNYFQAQAGVIVNLATGRASDGFGGVDTLLNINTVIGSAYDDVLTGSSRAVLEIFDGDQGDDVINGGAVTDRYNDTNGNRVTYYFTESAVEVDLALGTASGGAGNDILANITQVFATDFNDTLRGSDTDLVEQFHGGAGNDLIDGRGGLDQALYTEALAAVNVNLATGVARDGSGGTDALVDIEGVRGSAFDDILIGGNTDNGDLPGEGLEFFSGERGNDTIDGGAGFDRADYTSSIAAVRVVLGGTAAGSAADGFGGTDVLRNIEAVRGSNFNDVLTGSDSGAFESFEGRGGNDSINGMGGIDLVDYSLAGAAVNVNLGTGVAADGQGGSDTLANIEQVRGSLTGNDVLYGNALANKLEGLGGNDTLSGGAGADTMIGGDGHDIYYVDNAGDIVLETSARTAGGIDLVVSGISYKLGANLENLRLSGSGDINATGNSLNNVIYAGTGRNAIDGGAGTDTLSFENAVAGTTSGTSGVTLSLGTAGALTTAAGISGADTVLNIENLTGSKYDDKLTGNSGANVLAGGAGRDYLNGGSGNDVLSGGAGADWFTFSTALSNTGNVDTITDFALEDTIRLENAVFTRLAATGTLASANFKVIGSAALDANDYILYDKASGYLYYDADGSGAGAAAKIALVGSNLALTSGDFTVI